MVCHLIIFFCECGKTYAFLNGDFHYTAKEDVYKRQVQIGAAMFWDPWSPIHVVEGLDAYLEEKQIKRVSDIVGTVEPW